MREFSVPFTVRMKARIRLEDGENLEDAISDIDIPENHQCFYVVDSFEPGTPEELPGTPEEEEEPKVFTNHYRCPCGKEWEDRWSCACNDKCPECNKEIEPHTSVHDDDKDEVGDELHLDSDGCLKDNDGDAETDMEDRNKD